MRRRRSTARHAALESAGAKAAALPEDAGIDQNGSGGTADTTSSTHYSALRIDKTAWRYDEANGVYYQIGVSYVLTPQAEDYETLGIYVPGAYMDATENDDSTYTASIRPDGRVGDFTATTAPIVVPVNTPGYAAQRAPTEYSYDRVRKYMEAGFIYVRPGLRGRDSNTDQYTGNAPWGVTDLKAAVRFVRYNSGELPGDSESIYVFGHSGGGAQSAVMGASGDSELYEPYLNALGAAMCDAEGHAISDAVAGVMAWCPITGLDCANAAYEWNMGQFCAGGARAAGARAGGARAGGARAGGARAGGTWTAAYSDDLAAAFADYVNGLGLTDAEGHALMLEESEEGIYLSGSYYDYLVATIGDSLNNFLAQTEFPYTPSGGCMAGMNDGGRSEDTSPSTEDGYNGARPGDATTSEGGPEGGATSAGTPSSEGSTRSGEDSSTRQVTTYQTVQEYIDALNANGTWVTYDVATNTATITSLEGFVASQKSASKAVGAFDGVAASATENIVMGVGEKGLHFDVLARDVIANNTEEYSSYLDWSEEYGANQYDCDFAASDSLGVDTVTRANMYNPMYYLSASYGGYRSSRVAPNWRIRTGIAQGDTANTTELNLVLALENYGVESVDFATIWGQGHSMAELSGDGITNFIQWVRWCSR